MHYIDAGRLFSLLPIRLHNTLKVALTHEQQHGFISTHATLIFRRRRRRRFSLRFFFFFRFVVVVASAAAAGAVWQFSTLGFVVSSDDWKTDRRKATKKIKLKLNTKINSFEFCSRLVVSFRLHWENYRKLLYLICSCSVEEKKDDVTSSLNSPSRLILLTTRNVNVCAGSKATPAAKTFSFFIIIILHSTAPMTSMCDVHIDSMVTAMLALSQCSCKWFNWYSRFASTHRPIDSVGICLILISIGSNGLNHYLENDCSFSVPMIVMRCASWERVARFLTYQFVSV